MSVGIVDNLGALVHPNGSLRVVQIGHLRLPSQRDQLSPQVQVLEEGELQTAADLVSSPALGGGAEISGTNFGAYLEVLYKRPNVALMARAGAIAGDIQGVMLSFGFAF